MKFTHMRYFIYIGISFFISSCASKLTYEYTMEVNLPIEKTWEIFIDPNNAALFTDKLEFIDVVQTSETESIQTVKYKGIKDPISYYCIEDNLNKKTYSKGDNPINFETFMDFI